MTQFGIGYILITLLHFNNFGTIFGLGPGFRNSGLDPDRER